MTDEITQLEHQINQERLELSRTVEALVERADRYTRPKRLIPVAVAAVALIAGFIALRHWRGQR